MHLDHSASDSPTTASPGLDHDSKHSNSVDEKAPVQPEVHFTPAAKSPTPSASARSFDDDGDLVMLKKAFNFAAYSSLSLVRPSSHPLPHSHSRMALTQNAVVARHPNHPHPPPSLLRPNRIRRTRSHSMGRHRDHVDVLLVHGCGGVSGVGE